MRRPNLNDYRLRSEWRHGDLPTQRPEYFDRPYDERELVRTKTFALEPISVDEAAFDRVMLVGAGGAGAAAALLAELARPVLTGRVRETRMEEELTDHLGYEPYEAQGRNSGNSRNGYYRKKVRTSEGETDVRVPRDRNGEYEPKILRRYASNTNELEEKIIGLYAKGMSTRDIQDTLHELYGVEISAQSISTITDKIV